MNDHAIHLDYFDLGLSAVLVLLAGLVSLALRLRLEGQLALAAVRTVVQLILVGYVLRYVFELRNGWLVAGVVLAMFLLATHAAVRRSERKLPHQGVLAFASLVASSLLTCFLVTGVVIRVEPWWEPRYMIPLLGMILGNSLTAVSLCLDSLLATVADRRNEIEMELALGATRWEAARRPLRLAVRRGMIPTINAMMVVGVVTLPGMMTGQILQGADPLQATHYQIVVMFMIAAASALGCIGIALLLYRTLFNARHQLRADLLKS